MKKSLIALFFVGSLGLNANATSEKLFDDVAYEFTDCMALAQGYYNFLISEGESARRANRRANTFLNSCLTAQQ